jgi:hypothetical protein
MKRTIFALVSVLSLAGYAAPARADDFTRCVIQAVKECDEQFPPGDRWNTAIRGWCYMIQTGMCMAMEQ